MILFRTILSIPWITFSIELRLTSIIGRAACANANISAPFSSLDGAFRMFSRILDSVTKLAVKDGVHCSFKNFSAWARLREVCASRSWRCDSLECKIIWVSSVLSSTDCRGIETQLIITSISSSKRLGFKRLYITLSLLNC